MLPIDADNFKSPKIIDIHTAKSIILKEKQLNKKVGLCHGGFDLLHPGHVLHFDSAKKMCDILIVSITSNRFVSSRKGLDRPIFSDKIRAYMVANIEYVNYVIISDYKKAIPIIEILKPSFYIKGPDFINKTTIGISSEREAILNVNGEMKYTQNVKLGTTQIIDYVKKIDRKKLLLIIDRDGTIIENDDFPGKENNWEDKLKLKKNVVNFLNILQTKYKTTKIVVSNQSGVARGYFDCKRVEDINKFIESKLNLEGITIDNWQYCPDVDSKFANLKKNELNLNFSFVKDVTRRKPHVTMVNDALIRLGFQKENFDEVFVIGNAKDDEILAKNLNSKFINVENKDFEKWFH
jgi:rfaE bifunctional protein nucleotidyltransferase chain/domain